MSWDAVHAVRALPVGHIIVREGNRDIRLTPKIKLLLIDIACRDGTGNTTGNSDGCTASYPTLGFESGMSERAVDRAVRAFRKADWVSVIRRGPRPNSIRINIQKIRHSYMADHSTQMIPKKQANDPPPMDGGQKPKAHGARAAQPSRQAAAQRAFEPFPVSESPSCAANAPLGHEGRGACWLTSEEAPIANGEARTGDAGREQVAPQPERLLPFERKAAERKRKDALIAEAESAKAALRTNARFDSHPTTNPLLTTDAECLETPSSNEQGLFPEPSLERFDFTKMSEAEIAAACLRRSAGRLTGPERRFCFGISMQGRDIKPSDRVQLEQIASKVAWRNT